MRAKTKYCLALLPVFFTSIACASDTATAYFTGPLLTSNAVTLPQNTILVEPYLIYSTSDGSYDEKGNHQQSVAALKQWQTIVPFYYGLTDRLQLQLTTGLSHATSAGVNSDGARFTDTTVAAQYMLQAPNADGTRPAISVSYSHRFPTGAYDRLDANPLNGTGSGASVDTLSLLVQQYVWLPNGRPLRLRATAGYSPPPSRVGVNGMSVYDTPANFRGHARLGNSLGISTSVEYSINPQWVLAMDMAYNRTASSSLAGTQWLSPTAGEPVWRRDPSRWVLSLAPAVEYNFNANIGLIVGTQFSVAGRNNAAFVTPQAALNMVF